LLAEAKTGDLIVCSELSRLGRNMFMIMSILNLLMINGVKIRTIKDNYRLGDSIQAKILAFAFGLAAEIERDLISQRTKEALARRFGVCRQTLISFLKTSKTVNIRYNMLVTIRKTNVLYMKAPVQKKGGV
jgi:DNA invertase Pin-like site-specific DNA recombinase